MSMVLFYHATSFRLLILFTKSEPCIEANKLNYVPIFIHDTP